MAKVRSWGTVVNTSRTMSSIVIVSPGFPDQPGGVTDHTRRLVANWSPAGPVSVHGAPGGDPASLVDAWRAQGVGAVLLQYVPFLYARRGLSRFPEHLVRGARAAGLRTTVFVHEPWVPPTRLPWLILNPLQRRQLLRLAAAADRTVTAVPAWRAQLGAQTEVIAVGSTLGPAREVNGPPLTAPVVFSPLASGLRWDWILAAVDAIGASPGLIVIGATLAEAAAHLPGRYARAAWEWRGRQPASDALDLLARAPLVLAPFEDGITARRTSALAALSTGARVVTSSGHLYDAAFDGGPIVAHSPSEFAALAARTWRESDTPQARAARRAWHDARFLPATLDERLRALVAGN
jgi:hypothetical protein